MRTPKRKMDWAGLTCITIKSMKNGLQIIPEGTVCRIGENKRGLTLETEKCRCCGVQVFIKCVHESSVRLIDSEENERTLKENEAKSGKSGYWNYKMH